MQEKVSAQYKNEIEMAKAQRDYELKKADYDIEVNTKKAESEMAYQLQVHSPRLSQLSDTGTVQGPDPLFFTSFFRWPKPSSASRRRRCRFR